MKFRAAGSETVFFSSYLAALNGAIENSVAAAVKYINNDGKTE